MKPKLNRSLALATAIYWILLAYIIVALFWWFISLLKQNETMFELRKKQALTSQHSSPSESINRNLQIIQGQRKKNIGKYIGEGSLFLALILVGAAYLYRSVKGQFRQQILQQNFTMAVTHELKTPLAVARLNLETLQKHELDEQRRRKLLTTALQETMRLDGLINNILISSQLEGQAYQTAKQKIDFTGIVQSSAEEFRQRYAERPILINTSNTLLCMADPMLIKLLINNLLENANKYGVSGGAIEIKASQKNHSVLLEVSDQGPGIPESERKKIFKKFYRMGNEQTRKTKGTGLGLYICKHIAKEHGGHIQVTINRWGGSTFIVQLPAL